VISATSNKFPKSKRLLKHADFRRVYENGRRQFTGNMTVFFLRRGGPEETTVVAEPRVGFTVGKVVGGAVERNRIKRRMRDAVRVVWADVDGPIDVVFNPRRSVLGIAHSELVSEVTRALKLATQRARPVTAEQLATPKEERKSSRKRKPVGEAKSKSK
jgi:ribonuclease P protein component